MLEDLFLAHSHDVQFAHDNREAFKKIIAFAPELIIIDVWLGIENGKELCKEIRVFNKKVRVVLMSENADNLLDYEICEANDIIKKPFDTNDLLTKVHNLLLKKP